METRNYWEENGHTVNSVKYENYNSNDGFGRGSGEQLFAVPSEDEAEYPPGAYLKKGKQDPMSHRIIEKRRRDRMNNCLADLSRLIPPEYLKKGRGRVEKTEIIEMAIRHLKYLQERVNGLYQYNGSKGTAQYVAERQAGQEFRAGYQQAVSEALRFLVEVHGFRPGEGLCASLAAHLQRHAEHIVKGEAVFRQKPMSHPGSSSDVGSSSSSSQSYIKPGVIRRTEPPTAPQYPVDEEKPSLFPMECDRVSQMSKTTEGDPPPESDSLPLDVRKRETSLRSMRKQESHDEFLHSYKFKNSIERRFSRSQDCEAADMSIRSPHPHLKPYSHKRRRSAKPAPSISTSASGSTEDAQDTSPQDTSSDHYEKPAPTSSKIPVFALNALGKYYVPLYVDYACLARYLGPYDVLDARAASAPAPLHPVSIHVNFQPCFNIHHNSRQEPYRQMGPV